MAENIDFNWPLKEACKAEIKRYCGGVPHGRGRVIRWGVGCRGVCRAMSKGHSSGCGLRGQLQQHVAPR